MKLRTLCRLVLLTPLLSACAVVPQQPRQSGACDARLQTLHQAALDAGIADVQAGPVGEYSYLRADRLLWDMLPHLTSDARRAEWVGLSLQQGLVALRADHGNLPGQTPLDGLVACLEGQAAQLASRADYLARLAERPYPGEYIQSHRVLGIYPITRAVMLSRLAPLHVQLKARYRRGPIQPLRVYGPRQEEVLAPSQISNWLREAYAGNALGLPLLDATRAARLLAHFAPVWEIETRGDYDLPGAPGWRSGQAAVDVRHPVAYSQLSYTRWKGEMLLQLSYVLWFDERPAAGPVDIYAGRLDGLILRLTLDTAGRPMMVDSIHPCGCYHTLAPLVKDLRLRSETALGEAPLLVRVPAREKRDGERLHVGVGSGDHMLIGLRWDQHPGERGQRYTLGPLDQLRSLQLGSGRRSLYSPPYGLVDGTQRSERLFLWPSGIVSPGAMRQWGRHAIAFSAVRYFDDPNLMQQLFVTEE